MTEKAEWAKLYVFFRQLSDAHKREILKRAEALALAEGRERPETKKKKHGENDDDKLRGIKPDFRIKWL